jgi:sortase A
MRNLVLAFRLEYVFWVAGALLCGYTAGAYLESRVFQARENRRLEEALTPAGPHSLPAPPPHVLSRTTGSLVGRLEIPRLKVSTIVLEGSDSRTLRLGVGLVSESAGPGESGNMVLGGHRDTFFRPLRRIHAGDRLTLVTPRGRYRYEVQWTSIIKPTDTSVLKPTRQPSLTLVTCYPFWYVGAAPERFVVRARLVG